MARFSYIVAALAFTLTANAQQACIEGGVSHPDTSTWTGGQNGCASYKCNNGVTTVVADHCPCTFPDGKIGYSGVAWVDNAACRTCSCVLGGSVCTALPACTTVTSTVAATVTVGATVTTTTTPIYKCQTVDGVVMNVGDVYTADCLHCVCQVNTGLQCQVAQDCSFAPPAPAPTPTQAGCWVRVGRHNRKFISDGSYYMDVCRNCMCAAGKLSCQETCTVAPPPPLPITSTVTIAPPPAPVTSTITIAPTVAPAGFCTKTDGTTVPDGGSYQTKSCKKCTCKKGTFYCKQVCTIAPGDCKDSNGKTVLHGKTVKDSCKTCKCNDGTLSCKSTCPSSKCKNSCLKCTCDKGKWPCVDTCNTCECEDGTVVANGRSWTDKCKECICKKGKLECKNTGAC